jgi:hypothetical protein
VSVVDFLLEPEDPQRRGDISSEFARGNQITASTNQDYLSQPFPCKLAVAPRETRTTEAYIRYHTLPQFPREFRPTRSRSRTRRFQSYRWSLGSCLTSYTSVMDPRSTRARYSSLIRATANPHSPSNALTEHCTGISAIHG